MLFFINKSSRKCISHLSLHIFILLRILLLWNWNQKSTLGKYRVESVSVWKEFLFLGSTQCNSTFNNWYERLWYVINLHYKFINICLFMTIFTTWYLNFSFLQSIVCLFSSFYFLFIQLVCRFFKKMKSVICSQFVVWLPQRKQIVPDLELLQCHLLTFWINWWGGHQGMMQE